jgi:hypothetical protein
MCVCVLFVCPLLFLLLSVCVSVCKELHAEVSVCGRVGAEVDEECGQTGLGHEHQQRLAELELVWELTPHLPHTVQKLQTHAHTYTHITLVHTLITLVHAHTHTHINVSIL